MVGKVSDIKSSEIGDVLDRSKYLLEFEDNFSSLELDQTKWIPHYLPQWKNRESSRARYRLEDKCLRLLIEEDQQPWAPEHNGEIRVSNFQTGVFSGPLGSIYGQHRFREGLVVQEVQELQVLFTPTYGLIELRAQALKDHACMVALWMIGFESDPSESAEICIMEIFGDEIGSDSGVIGVGVHPFFDPDIREDFSKITVRSDLSDWHTYSVEWSSNAISFYFDDSCIKVVEQSINYPMQLMLNIYEFTRDKNSTFGYPKEFLVDWVRGYRPLLANPA